MTLKARFLRVCSQYLHEAGKFRPVWQLLQRHPGPLAALCALGVPAAACAWGVEGHQVVVTIARDYLSPQVRAKVDQMLAADPDTLTAHDIQSESVWADRYRGTHKETTEWHYVDIELDHPDLKQACYGYPASPPPASQGPGHDCIVDKITQFTQELASPATPVAERLLALKFLIHFVGDIHQPLHAGDNHDKGGNCVLLNLGGMRQVNLHAYWDTTIVQTLDTDPLALAATLERNITPTDKAEWEQADPQAWAMEGFDLARTVVYMPAARPGCDDPAPVSLPAGYEDAARKVATVQLEKAGVRLAALLNRALGD